MPDLDTMDFVFDDPKPAAKKAPSAAKKTVGRPSAKATAQREIAEQLNMLITVVSIPISAKDPHCGPVLAENAKPIADALAAQAVQSPTLMKWLETLTAPTGWVGVGMAFWPVAQAIAEHHVLPVIAKRGNAAEFDTMPQFTPSS